MSQDIARRNILLFSKNFNFNMGTGCDFQNLMPSTGGKFHPSSICVCYLATANHCVTQQIFMLYAIMSSQGSTETPVPAVLHSWCGKVRNSTCTSGVREQQGMRPRDTARSTRSVLYLTDTRVPHYSAIVIIIGLVSLSLRLNHWKKKKCISGE
jgi:hypothetical protein